MAALALQPLVAAVRWRWHLPALGVIGMACAPPSDGNERAHAGSEVTRGASAASNGHPPIEIVVATEAETLDPRYATDPVSMRATRLIHAGLVRLDPDTLTPIPYVAQSWAWLDGQTLRLELRADARFHSGKRVTPADVIATLRALGSKAVGSRLSHVVEAIGAVTADGETGVVVRLAHPHATLLTDLEVPVLRADEAEGPPAPSGTLDGLGPYAVESIGRGVIALRRADHSAFEAKVGADAAPRVVVRTIRDENARALRLLGGRTDIAVGAISPTLLPALRADAGLSVRSRPGANLTYLLMRVDRGPLADVRVRRALSLGIDRETLAATLLAGHAEAATTLMPPAHWAYSPLPPLAYDPEAARRELARAAFAGDSTDPLATPSAPPARIHLTWLTSTDRLRLSLVRVMAQSLRDVGFDIEIIALDLGTMIARLNAGDFDIASLQMPELTEPNVLWVFLHSSSIPPAGANRGRVRDPELDALLDRGDQENDPEARRKIYARMEQRVRDTLPIIPLFHEDQVTVTSARARAFQPSAEGRWLAVTGLLNR